MDEEKRDSPSDVALLVDVMDDERAVVIDKSSEVGSDEPGEADPMGGPIGLSGFPLADEPWLLEYVCPGAKIASSAPPLRARR